MFACLRAKNASRGITFPPHGGVPLVVSSDCIKVGRPAPLRGSWASCSCTTALERREKKKKKKFPSSDFSPFCIISVSCSLSFALKSNQLPGFLFMSPGSDALASKLCKCILPVKLKPSLLVLRGLLHTVLHHFFGSGPYISHRNETSDDSTSSLPFHLPTCLFPPPSARLSLRFPPGTGAVGGCLQRGLQLNR